MVAVADSEVGGGPGGRAEESELNIVLYLRVRCDCDDQHNLEN